MVVLSGFHKDAAYGLFSVDVEFSIWLKVTQLTASTVRFAPKEVRIDATTMVPADLYWNMLRAGELAKTLGSNLSTPLAATLSLNSWGEGGRAKAALRWTHDVSGSAFVEAIL